jgi:signal peptidase I
MYPLFNGIGEERVAVFKLSHVQRGDVIVAKPKNEKEKIIKRVIGMPGDKIQIRSGKVYVNDQELLEPYLVTNTFTSSPTTNITVLKNDQYFLMGDNRTSSQDSRQIGPISKEEIVGRAVFQYYPPSDFQFFKRINK